MEILGIPGHPVLESMRASEPGLQAVSNIADSMIKNTHFFSLLILFRDMILNIGKSPRHYRCLYSEGKAIKPTNFIFVAKHVFLQAPSNLKNRLAGSGGDSRTSPRNTQNTRILSSINREPRYQIEYFNTTRARPQLDFFSIPYTNPPNIKNLPVGPWWWRGHRMRNIRGGCVTCNVLTNDSSIVSPSL